MAAWTSTLPAPDLKGPSAPVARRATLVVARPVTVPVLADLGRSVLPDPGTVPGDVEPVDVEAGLAAGWSAGYEQGLAAGRVEAAAEVAEELATLRSAREHARSLVVELSEVLTAVEEGTVAAAEATATSLAEAALELASALVGREVAAGCGAEALARALAVAPANAPAVARMHPEDLVGLAVPRRPGLTLEADPDVPRGGCILDLPDATVDASLETAFARVRSVLLGEDVASW